MVFEGDGVSVSACAMCMCGYASPLVLLLALAALGSHPGFAEVAPRSRCADAGLRRPAAAAVLVTRAWTPTNKNKAQAKGGKWLMGLRGGKGMEGGTDAGGEQAGISGDAVGDGEQGGGLSLPLLRNLLDFSTRLTNTNTSDSNSSSGRAELDPEKMQWLNQALTSMVENTTDVFKNSISDLSLPENTPEEVRRKEVALENLEERVEQLDLAQGLYNLGGVGPVLTCLESAHGSIQQRAAGVVAACVQNNIDLKDAVVQLGALPKLLAVYSNRTLDSEVRAKALSAAGVLIRGNSTLELSFLHNQGLAMLRADMLIGEVRLRRKAVFTLSQLITSNPMLRAAVLKIESWEEGKGKGILPELVETISHPDAQVSEFACRALRSLLASSWPGAGSSGPEVARLFPNLVAQLEERLEDSLKECGGEEGDEHNVLRDVIALLGGKAGPQAREDDDAAVSNGGNDDQAQSDAPPPLLGAPP